MAPQKLKGQDTGVSTMEQGPCRVTTRINPMIDLFKFFCRNCCMQKLLWLKGRKSNGQKFRGAKDSDRTPHKPVDQQDNEKEAKDG